MRKHRLSGFTLVELLVVIGIIALLISILLPSLARAREQSRMTKCLSNQREITKGAATFQNDHRARLQLVASHKLGGGAAPQSALDRLDPTRRTYEYYDYPENEYSGALSDIRNKELVIWPVAYGEAAGFNFGKKNWKWGARADSYDLIVSGNLTEAIEKDAYKLGVCPSDKIKIGSPGWPDSSNVGNGFDATLVANGDVEAIDAANMVADHYYGALSFGMNEDIVGAETPNATGQILPACFKGIGGSTPVDALANECFGATDDCAQPRLAGDMDKVFQPSNTIFLIDAGMDKGPSANSAQRIMLINSDDFVIDQNGIDGVTASNVNPGVRANLGWFTYAHQIDMPTAKTQVLPTRRHTDGRLNVLYADFHGAAVVPVAKAESSGTGPKKKVPVLFADGLTSGVWITPYSVGKYYDVAAGLSPWPPEL